MSDQALQEFAVRRESLPDEVQLAVFEEIAKRAPSSPIAANTEDGDKLPYKWGKFAAAGIALGALRLLAESDRDHLLIIMAGVFALWAFGIWNKKKFSLWIAMLFLVFALLWALFTLVSNPRESGFPLVQFIYLALQIPYFWRRRREFR